MKRSVAVLLAMFTSGSLLTACDDSTTTSSTSSSSSGSGGSGGEAGSGGGQAGSGGGQAGGGGEGGGNVDVCGDGTLANAEACDDGNTNDGDGCASACTVETGYACDGTPSVCATVCSDGIIAGIEECDDGNSNDGDGCDLACVIETGYACSDMPSVCAAVCGDGNIVDNEECDDGNANDGDGCDLTCAIETGFVCDAVPSVCAAVCSDGIITGAEACDDGNSNDGDGCSSVCAIDTGYECNGMPSVCLTVCSDGTIAGMEQCDDGNTNADDGCSGICVVEPGYVCNEMPSVCATVCGDGYPAGSETCDDGNTNSDDGCSNACMVESGYVCNGIPSMCATVCGDGIIAGSETCDDGNTNGGDGCNMACAIETGFVCTAMPSVCNTVCGDGIIAGAEICDDGNLVDADGCGMNCVIESGYVCTSTPSVCNTVCGDGIIAGAEVCDDGNVVSGDGCNAACTPSTGEDCSDTMAMSQATVTNGVYSWTIPDGSVVNSDGDFACDPNTHGPDVVIKYVKTSADLANGGKLLHIKADTPLSSSTADYLNFEVTTACPSNAFESLKCLWYKDNWDSYLDVPAGTYYIWAQKNSPATTTVRFPDVNVIAEEVDAIAGEGEGCFAPYTSSSSVYTPPAGSGLPHTWTIPASINSFDIAATWGEPGSISCDNSAGYGDIHGVDAVIQFDKQSPSSVLKIDVQNLDPTLTQSDLNLEVLNTCNTLDMNKISRNCRANRDSISITAPSDAGPVYLWLSAEGTSESFNGALVQVTEFFPGPGESWPTAQPLSGSSTIVATSTQRLDVPSCFGATDNVHWFSYTLTNEAFFLQGNAAGIVGVYDEGGQEVACTTDASTTPVRVVGAPGKTLYVAVQSPSPITSVTIGDSSYSGVGTVVTDMLVTFPTSPLSEYGMATDGSQIFMGDTSSVFAFANTVGATALEYGSAQGIGTAHLGYDLVFAGTSLFSADTTTTTTTSRIYRIFDGTTWGPAAAWDTTPTYTANSPIYSIATDGTDLFHATRRTTVSTDFYSLSLNAAGVPTALGTNTGVWYVVGMAADDKFLYVASNGASGEGVYRLNRSNITAAAVKIATINTGTLCNNIELDAFASANYLYVRDAVGDVHAIAQPASASPVHVGAISALGTASDYAMTFDKAAGALYLFETETDSAGRIVKIQ